MKKFYSIYVIRVDDDVMVESVRIFYISLFRVSTGSPFGAFVLSYPRSKSSEISSVV